MIIGYPTAEITLLNTFLEEIFVNFKNALYKKLCLFFLLLLIFCCSSQANADSTNMKQVINDITKIYMSSMTYIFKNQPLINQKSNDKSELFGQQFIDNLRRTYRIKYSEDFPQEDHYAKTILLQTMVEVMESNRELLYDKDIGFKGIIPATFAFQISAKLATKGIGFKIKFTRTAGNIRNILNRPDAWETSVMKKIIKTQKIHYDDNALLNNKPAIRQFTPLPMAPFCLSCHGKPENNPLNIGKSQSNWTDIDITGFKMEHWTINDFGGGVSISIEKSFLK